MIAKLDAHTYNLKPTEITSVEFDSRRVSPGALFIALHGEQFDGHDFVDDAHSRGAAAVMTEHKLETPLPQVVVADTRKAMGQIARIFYRGADDMLTIGVTGTNGKTTTAFLIHSILAQARMQPALIGTICYLGKTRVNAVRTTPESLDLFKMIADFRKQGSQAVVMEVSSHALSLQRVDAMCFRVAVFTNLSQDHLDFHGSLDAYKAAKLKIFSLLDTNGYAIYNCDDPVSREIENLPLKNRIPYGVQQDAIVRTELLDETSRGIEVAVTYQGEQSVIRSPLLGRFNMYNIGAAFATGIALGLDREVITAGTRKLHRVEGRMQHISKGIFVDYAHTPSALENALEALRALTQGKLILVFGCGGNRDKEKRPMMAAIASRGADFIIITNDNPRKEKPQQIISDIEKGMTTRHYKVIEDRRQAIQYACSMKRKDDVVLVAGKGHESYQVIGDEVTHFNDAEVIRECIMKS